MGRVSMHHTHEGRGKATAERRREYSRTSRYDTLYNSECSLEYCSSAKLLRKEQNRHAYQKRIEGKSKLVPTWPTIPRVVHQQGALPLPTSSRFFKNEFRVRNDVSDDDTLAKWDHYPPYATPLASFGTNGLELVVDRLHGWRLRAQLHFETWRLRQYEESSDDEILAGIDRDIQANLRAWKELSLMLQMRPDSPVDHTMGHHLLQWKARHIVDLLADWKVLKKGRVNRPFNTHFINRWSKY